MLTEIPIRKIIHVDMDAFFASVEQLDNPKLQGKPVAVGGGSERGVVAAASYEARKFGVRSAMPGRRARKLCPSLIFVPPRFDRYKEISAKIREIFFDYTNLVEPLSLDEAYLDVTENKKNNPSATHIAREIRQRIKQELKLNASAGISINKFTAKIASDINKPNGQKTISPEEVISFLEELPIQKFFGVGKVTAKKMHQMGIFKGKDLKLQSLHLLQHNFGKQGQHFYNIVRGIQNSEVKPNRIRKSVGAENTFSHDISSHDLILQKLNEIAIELEKRLQKGKVKGRTVTLKLKYSDFTTHTRSKTLLTFVGNKSEFFSIIKELMNQEPIVQPVRLLGMSISNLNNNAKTESVDYQLKFDF